MKIGIAFVIGIAYVAFMVGTAVNSIGTTYEGGTYTWDLPLGVLFITGTLFYLGFRAGRESNK